MTKYKPGSIFLVISILTFSSCTQANHTHKWGNPIYKWSDDYSSCVATRNCLIDGSHIEIEAQQSISEIITQAGCESIGEIIYTVTFNNEAFKTQTTSLTLSPLGHSFKAPTYTWSNDYSNCTATRVCSRDESHIETETQNSTYEVITPATEESTGLGRYTVIFNNSNFVSQTHDVEIPKLDPQEHEYKVIENISRRMPAEFEPVSMVKMCYPINMPLSIYKEIAEDNKILLLCNPSYKGSSRIAEARNEFKEGGVNLDNVTFLDMDIDDDYGYWVRDFSPFYVFNDKDLSIVDFTYNRPRYEQNAVPSKLATYFNMPYSKMNITHTGGNLMQDGRFTAFSDDLVIKENSNNEAKVRKAMNDYCGTDNYVITIDPQGDYIAHIDCWGKIVAPDKIIVAKIPATNSRYDYYEQVATELGNTKCIYGYNYRIYRVEKPGGSVVAPYTNSLIANKHVYVPLGSNNTYNQKALQVYQEALPGYKVHGLQGFSSGDNRFLNTDALHCRTHEVPDSNMLFIDTRDVLNGTVAALDEYLVKANIVSYAKKDIDSVYLYYSINNEDYQRVDMSRYQETSNYTYTFSNLNSGDIVKYYIEATDKGNNKNVDPTCGSLDPHRFTISS